MMLTLRDLNECFDQANEVGASFIAVKIKMGLSTDEVIINPNKNFAEKQAYYNRAYDEALSHKFSGEIDISITAFTYGDSYKEIERNLEMAIYTGTVLN